MAHSCLAFVRRARKGCRQRHPRSPRLDQWPQPGEPADNRVRSGSAYPGYGDEGMPLSAAPSRKPQQATVRHIAHRRRPPPDREVDHLIARLPADTVIVSGGASGPDTWHGKCLFAPH
jgi:hypothetical protein